MNAPEQKKIVYDDGTVRKFIFASVLFGIVGMLVGVIIASQLAWAQLNFGVSFLTFSRLRPLHTNAVIFAFVGNMMFAGVYYSTQRLLKARMASDLLSKIHFWGWQLIIVAAAITLPLGITTGKEYAELEWPIDIAIALVWVVFGINFFWTLAKRNEKNLYVGLWFYISTVVTIAVLHIVNSMEMPLHLFKSYSVYAGVQDALVQWWYGHNAVAFFLTTPILGIMYYFLPKAAERPVYSYRLSIVHFWSLVFMYIWAGPHHLLGTALPEWAQSLGMLFSVALWAPSWGGMLNGLLTLRGAWDRVRADPVLKFFAAGVTFYGMATFEGPLLSIKSVNALSHYTDWTIGHAHGGALGWNGFMAAGMFYWLVPRLYGTKLRSTKAADLHFWIGTVGIIVYMVAMWASGISQGLNWRALNPDGSLQYPDFVETLTKIQPLYIARMLGGLMYLTGMIMMAWNLVATALSGKAVDGEVTVLVEADKHPSPGWITVATGRPVILAVVGILFTLLIGWTNLIISVVMLVAVFTVAAAFFVLGGDHKPGAPTWHALLEGRALLFTVLTLVSILIGGVAELIPTIAISKAVPAVGEKGSEQKPYSALELEGRDIYVREGCYTCHSQMIRTYQWEAQRYGAPSKPEEYLYDHPFQWGSKRTGPDLAREGGKYPNLWHYQHMNDPRAINQYSNMPAFAWLEKATVDTKDTRNKLSLMQKIGVPYSDREVESAEADAKKQGELISADLDKQGVKIAWNSELVALISYLQRLGRGPQMPAAGSAPVAAGVQ